MSQSSTPSPAAAPGSAREVLWAFLRLGCTSFGGPIAHLGYFRAEFVERRRWCGEEVFAEIAAISQSLPGPASSQTGFALGVLRAGWLGGLAAWTGFTLPSALLMLAFAFAHERLTGKLGMGAVHGLQLVAVAVVAQAVLAMRRSLAPDAARMLVAALAAILVYWTGQTLSAIAMGALLGWLLPDANVPPYSAVAAPTPRLSRKTGMAAAVLFCVLLVLLPAADALAPTISFASSLTHSVAQPVAVAHAFFRSGALVFGGGHVVLPLLERAVVARGWVSQADFLAGYGAAQALPGPLFCFAAYLGSIIRPTPSPLLLSAIALVAIFLPGQLLMVAIVPFWSTLRRRPLMLRCLRGVNASVVGVLIAALIRPVWTSAVHSPLDVAVAAAGLVLLVRYRIPPWLLVLSVTLISAVISAV
jgi:chromate transporter